MHTHTNHHAPLPPLVQQDPAGHGSGETSASASSACSAELAAGVSGGASSYAISLLMAEGAPPWWTERWDQLGQILVRYEFGTCAQESRMEKLANLEHDLLGCMDPKRAESLQRERDALRAKCQPPVRPAALQDPLWACVTELGLILVHGRREDVLGAVGSREAVLLLGVKAGDLIVRLDGAQGFPQDQGANYYSWAGQRMGVLFRFPTPEEMEMLMPA